MFVALKGAPRSDIPTPPQMVKPQLMPQLLETVGLLKQLVYTIYRRGSIITCQVQKHGTEIIKVKVWLHFITITKSDGAKIKTAMYKMDVNVQYV